MTSASACARCAWTRAGGACPVAFVDVRLRSRSRRALARSARRIPSWASWAPCSTLLSLGWRCQQSNRAQLRHVRPKRTKPGHRTDRGGRRALNTVGNERAAASTRPRASSSSARPVCKTVPKSLGRSAEAMSFAASKASLASFNRPRAVSTRPRTIASSSRPVRESARSFTFARRSSMPSHLPMANRSSSALTSMKLAYASAPWVDASSGSLLHHGRCGGGLAIRRKDITKT